MVKEYNMTATPVRGHTRNRKVGEYYYAPCGRLFQVFRVTSAHDGFMSGEKVYGEWFCTRDEAKSRVYELNGWRMN